MGDLYARMLKRSTLKCALVKSSNLISLPWRGCASLTHTHVLTHAQRHWDVDESLRCVFSGLWHPTAHFRSSTRLWRWKCPTMLSVRRVGGRMWRPFLGRTHTQSVKAVVKHTRGQNTNIWMFMWQLWISVFFYKGGQSQPWFHFD